MTTSLLNKRAQADKGWRDGPRHVHEQLRDRLLDAVVVPGTVGDRIPAERDLARTFGVSAMTISRALKSLQDEGYVERVPGKGTFLRASAQPVADEVDGRVTLPWEANTPTSGRVTPYTWIITNLDENPSNRFPEQWTHRAATALERSLQAIGGRTLLIDFGIGMSLHPFSSVREAIDSGVNSVVLLPCIDQNPEHRKLMQQLMRIRMDSPERLAVVEVSTGNQAQWPFDCVRYDSDWGVYRATDHLLKLGHKKFAFLGLIDQAWAHRRLWAFRNAVEEAGITEFHVIEGAAELEPGSPSNQNWPIIADRVVDAFVNSPAWNDATAVVGINDPVALRLLARCRELGRRVPESLSIVGFDDLRKSASEGLTTVHPPIEEAAETAVQILIRRMSMPYLAGREEVVANPSLVVRSSTRPPNTDANNH